MNISWKEIFGLAFIIVVFLVLCALVINYWKIWLVLVAATAVYLWVKRDKTGEKPDKKS